MSFAEIANRRHLRSVAKHLGELTWDVAADGYQRLKVPPSADVDSLLRLLLRRGLDPALAAILLDRFSDRPLERALIAWDIAAGSLLGDEDAALAQRLRAEMAPLKKLGATASAAVSRDRVDALVEAASTTGEGPSGDADAALEYIDRLALAHLPSLALAHAQILFAKHALPAALDRIVEIALDYERFDSVPVMSEQDERSLERQTYFGMRVALARLDTDNAMAILAQMSKHAAVARSTDPALTTALAELALLSDKPVGQSSVDAVSAVAPFGSTWRYGSRVRDELRIAVAPADAAIPVEGFISSFGNDMRIWAQAGYHDEPRAKLLALVSREIRYQSHDPNAWRALAVFVNDEAAEIELELQHRSAAQLAATLA